MKIDIVTPYGNNRFDLDVNKVTALIQMAYKYSELGRENMLEESKPETLQDAVAAAWGVVAEKEMEKIKETQKPSEMANSDAHRVPKKSRNDSLFGEGWRDIISRGSEARSDYEQSVDGYKGFLYIKCPACGEIKGFCTKSDITEHRCECGNKVPLEDLKPMYVHCECGEDFKYYTNMDEDNFNYKCINCGDIVKIRLNTRKTAYVTSRKNPGGGIDIYRKYGIRKPARARRREIRIE